MLRSLGSLVILGLMMLLIGCGSPTTSGPGQVLAPEPTATAIPATVPPAATAVPPTATATTAPIATAAIPSTTTTAPTATATVAPTATATVAQTATATLPKPTTGTGDAPRTTPTVPAATVGKMVVDSDNRCQVALPAGMTEDAPGTGEFTVENDGGFALLQSIEGAEFDTTVSLFITAFTPIFANYQETNRQKTADSEQVDFTGELINPVRGTMYFKRYGTVLCNIILMVYTSSAYPYEQALGTMIGSVQLVKP